MQYLLKEACCPTHAVLFCSLLQVSQCVTQDYPDLQLPSGLDAISGILYIPLSITGRDFIVLLRKGEIRRAHWAGRPSKDQNGSLEPRKSFKVGSILLTWGVD